MIKSLHLFNFQSHKASHLEFDPGVNVIIGPSDSGKTAIIRALRWLVWNRPSGDAFRSTWGSDTKVEVHLTDRPGSPPKIIRIKGKKETYFYENLKYVAFGKEVPEEITKALNLNDINLQSQLDSPFLLSNSPGQVAKHFNRVAHLDQIDEGLGKVQKWIREIDQDISSNDRQVIQLSKDLLKFEHLEKFEVEVEVLEGMETQMIQQVNSKRTLERLCLDSYSVKGLIEKQEKITEAGPLVDTIINWYAEIEQLDTVKGELEGLLREIEEVENDLEDESKILGAEKSVSLILALIEEQTEEQENCSVLQKLVKRILYTIEEQITAQNSSKRLQTEFNAVFPDTCPLCGKSK